MFYLKKAIECYPNNYGQFVEVNLRFQLTGIIQKVDATPFNEGSDIEPLKMSVKSNHFTLASNLQGATYEEQRDDFFNRCVSEVFAYVTLERKVYVMNCLQFREFLDNFHEIDTDKKTGKITIRGKKRAEGQKKSYV